MTTHEQDDDLGRAFRAVRDRFDGTHPDSDATLRRALLATRKSARTRKVAVWVVLPLAAALAASTAWAGATGRLAPAISSVLETFHGERPEPASQATSSPTGAGARNAPSAPAASAASGESATEPTPAEPIAEPIVLAPEPVAAPAQSARVPGPIVSATPAPPATAATASTAATAAPPAPIASITPPVADPNAALFDEANRLHFIARDPARALAAWDRYLAAAPAGKFAREARYNRALALIRVGRHAEAKRELESFANGTWGEYRRSEARALLDALARDE